MALSTRERIDILIVELALITVHLGIDPDRFTTVWCQKNGWTGWLLRPFAAVLFHDSLLCVSAAIFWY